MRQPPNSIPTESSGVSGDAPFQVDQSKWFAKEMVIKNSKVQTIDDLRAVTRLLEQGKIDTRSLVSGVMSYDEYDAAVEKLYRKEAIKILMEW